MYLSLPDIPGVSLVDGYSPTMSHFVWNLRLARCASDHDGMFRRSLYVGTGLPIKFVPEIEVVIKEFVSNLGVTLLTNCEGIRGEIHWPGYPRSKS